jgi:hypothetical protein
MFPFWGQQLPRGDVVWYNSKSARTVRVLRYRQKGYCKHDTIYLVARDTPTLGGQASRKPSFWELTKLFSARYLLSSFPYFSLAPGRRHTLIASAGFDIL